MAKLKKIMTGMLFAFILAMGISAEGNHAHAATTKNFKGNLNASYKSSEYKSKITFKKISAKEVTVKVVAGGITQGKFKGKIISPNTIKMKLDAGEIIKLKWKDKSSFTAKPTNGFDPETIQMVRVLCYSLNNEKYKQVKKNDTMYYSSNLNDLEKKQGAIYKISFKKKKMIIKGSFKKYKNPNSTAPAKLIPVANRTFKINAKTKFYEVYAEAGVYEETIISKKKILKFLKAGTGSIVITVKKRNCGFRVVRLVMTNNKNRRKENSTFIPLRILSSSDQKERWSPAAK